MADALLAALLDPALRVVEQIVRDPLRHGIDLKSRPHRLPGLQQRVRTELLGHLQRGGSPSAFDRALCSIFGAEAVELIAAGQFGQMVANRPPETSGIPIAEAVGQLRTVPLDSGFVQTARALGISLGD